MSKISDCKIIQFPKIYDPRGNLTFLEGREHIPFTIKRAYWLYDVPGGETRGGHAYKKLQEAVISLSGSFDLVLDDGRDRWRFSLNRSYMGVYVPNMIWRTLENFSTNSFCLILASLPFSEEDYLRDYQEFQKLKSSINIY